MTEQKSLTDTVPVAAAIKRVTTPAPVVDRQCPVCGLKPPAGVVRHVSCR